MPSVHFPRAARMARFASVLPRRARISRKRLPNEAFAAAHEVVLDGLPAHGLQKGTQAGDRKQPT